MAREWKLKHNNSRKSGDGDIRAERPVNKRMDAIVAWPLRNISTAGGQLSDPEHERFVQEHHHR